ncbi:unnamed protein product [Zymoseptoria tritici ST99CH_3D7]|uniref:GST N-terminal domain-containing protein n=1 Tax=Zymoseptoria tritici (strain ST99CH_3D7) TaxID=1276538 RepID=A0A1X7SA98_ZYMT9|nr:unnamed protein product [Zymoseptoria tritici ST99CH_3D7]
MPATLYTSSASGNSYKIRLLASILHIPLQEVEIDLQADEQHSEKYLTINPRGEVPCLVDDGKLFNDSSAILVWLAGKYGNAGKQDGPSSYWSKDVGEQAEIVNWLSFANSWIQYGVFTPRAMLSYGGPFNGLGPASKWTKLELETLFKEGVIRSKKSLQVLDAHLAGAKWLALGRPTIADLAVFVYVALAPMGDVSLEPYGHVEAWIDRVKGLEGFVGIEGLEDPLVHVERWRTMGREGPSAQGLN